MLKDITLSHFWILMRMGYNMQTIYDANYGEKTENLYLDYKDYVPHSKKQGKMLKDLNDFVSKLHAIIIALHTIIKH